MPEESSENCAVCVLDCISKRKTHIILLVGERHDIGVKYLYHLIQLAVDKEINLFLEGRQLYKIPEPVYPNYPFQHFKQNTNDIQNIEYLKSKNEKALVKKWNLLSRKQQSTFIKPNLDFSNIKKNSYENIFFLDQTISYLFSSILLLRLELCSLEFWDYVEDYSARELSINDLMEEVNVFLVDIYKYYYKYIDYFLEWAPTLFKIIKSRYKPEYKDLSTTILSKETIIIAIVICRETFLSHKILREELSQLIINMVTYNNEAFSNIMLPPSITLEKLLKSYIVQNYDSDRLLLDWVSINDYLRDKDFSNYIKRKIKSNILSVVICGYSHLKGIKTNLEKEANINPLLIHSNKILEAISYYKNITNI